jgi:hypothetical protein
MATAHGYAIIRVITVSGTSIAISDRTRNVAVIGRSDHSGFLR